MWREDNMRSAKGGIHHPHESIQRHVAFLHNASE